ncbi:GNAT family N-acetyltransferase [Nitratireductor pacificus]|uniref:N-acetyltransferase domain-containing protein n=1 Tax=Nitratireductor pacificus pht-3B TaxID=391937 RepID=K2LGE3_9HYPH|nr:GNAT family N-acetyltransferase [Nitratireductor pacificus]EKF16829.1 hypothetical protein NA2_21068 [Nitratireductor pacificus pht-3B]
MDRDQTIFYGSEADLPVDAFRRVLAESGLGAIRPVDDAERLGRMVSGANLIVTARRGAPEGPLVGVARCVTDFSWCAFVPELAVSRDAQGLGIGQGLLAEARRLLGPEVALFLVSVPEAVGFYKRAGMEHLADSFMFRRTR